MKEILSVILILLMAMALAGAAYAGPEDYYKARTAAMVAASQGDLDAAYAMYNTAGNEAAVLAAIPEEQAKVDWKTISEWQYNSAAYVYIKNFKLKTGWYEAMEALKTIPNGPERLTAMNVLYDSARPYLKDLQKAKAYLEDIPEAFTKAGVIAKVKSNIAFCKWVLDNVK